MATEQPRVDELTSWAAIEGARIIERSFFLWWRDQGGLYRGRGAIRGASSSAFRAGFDLARQLFLRESTHFQRRP